MKRNIEPSSGSSEEDKTSLKKAKKENSGKRKNTETEITESIDGCKKRVTNYNGKVQAPLPEVKRVCTEQADDQKTAKNKTGCNVNHKNDSGEETGNSNDEEVITEIISREAFTNGRYKECSNNCSGETEVEDILQESISSCDEETTGEDGSRREKSMINDEEYILLAEKLAGLFRDIYRDARAQNWEENSISKCQVRSKTHGNVMGVSNAGKGESYLCNKTTASSEGEYNSSYACDEVSDTSNVAERSDEGLGKEASDYNRDSEVKNERHDESNNLRFGEDTTNSKCFRDISFENCDINMREKSNSSCNSEMNDEGLGKEISDTFDEENCVQSGEINRNREEENSNPAEKTDNFVDSQSKANSYEECSSSGTSDGESDSSSDVKMSDEEGGGDSSSDKIYDKRCIDIINDKKIMKCKLENNNSSDEGDSSELDGESDMSTDEEYSWSRESSSDEESNSLGTDESDNSSEEEIDDDNTEISDETNSPGTEESDSSEEESSDDNTDEISDEESNSLGTEESDNSEEESDIDQSSGDVSSNYGEENSDTSSGEDDSTDSKVSVGESDTSIDEDGSIESEDDNNDDSEMIDEEKDKNTNYGEDIDSEWEDISPLSNEKRRKIRDITDDESSNSTCEERNNSTDTVAHYRGTRENVHNGNDGLKINILVEINVSKVYRYEGMYCHQTAIIMSVDGRHKKRVVANRKGNIITPSVRRNVRDEKTERSRNTTKNKVGIKNKAAEMSDAEEQMSDEETERQVKDSTDRKIRNKKSHKQIEYASDLKENGESDDHNEGDDEDSSEGAGEDSSDGAGEDNDKGVEEEEDIGEESSDEDFEGDGDEENEGEEDDEDGEVNEHGLEYVEEEDEEENEDEDIEEEENEEDIEGEEDIEDEDDMEEDPDEIEAAFAGLAQALENCEQRVRTKTISGTQRRNQKQ